MLLKTLIKTSQYYDSVTLMAVASDLAHFPGVQDASVVMGTEANKALLQSTGLLTAEAEAATPNDLVVAVCATEQAVEAALAQAEHLLQKKQALSSGSEYRPRTLRAGLKATPGANLAVISVAGRYATDEAWEALHSGLHVLLFSDNVSLEDEIALKRYASQQGLLLMGPGAGTAILNGAALGFANRLPAGPVGVVSAAGTGLQEVTCLLARQGVGITQGIGTGGRDLKEAVGGIMMLDGLSALQQDPATHVIVLVSKPPAQAVAEKILALAGQGEVPTVVCFLGGRFEAERLAAHVWPVDTLQTAAALAARLVLQADQDPRPALAQALAEEETHLKQQAASLCAGLASGQHYLRGLYSGGTLCYEAQVVWRDLLKTPVYSNAPLEAQQRLADSLVSQGHSAIDLGEEEFTVGRPHPMIDNDLRIRRLLQEGRDLHTAVILLDVVLGYGAHPDPAAELGPAIRQARSLAEAQGRSLPVIVAVTGTAQDPQGFARQVQALQTAGATLCDSNAAAARLAAYCTQTKS